MASADPHGAVPERPGWFNRRRYGSPVAVVGSVVAFVVLIGFAGYTAVQSFYLTSIGGCFDADGQMPTCPATGPDWARPVPAAAVLLGPLAGLVGVLAGRPVRVAALGAGFLLIAAALVVSRLMSPA